MKVSEVNLFDECFTHIDGAKQTTWNATAVTKWCEANKIEILRVPVVMEQAEWLMANRGVERERLMRLGQAAPTVIVKPIVFIHDATDDSNLLVDGTHRYVLLAGWKVPYIRAYIVEREQVTQFIIEDLPVMTTAEVMSPSLLNAVRLLFGDR